MSATLGNTMDLCRIPPVPPARPVLDIDNLPPLPEVAWRILELTSDLYLGVGQLSELIARDHALTARVLRIANSAFFRRTREIKTVRDAAVLLGNRKIRGVVVAASLGGVMQRSPHGRYLWEHALGVALASRELALQCRVADPDDAFVAGLLHDIGKGLFDLQLPQPFMEAVAWAQANPDLSTLEAERTFLGWTHTEVGELVASAWNLPEVVTEAIIHHHNPSQSALYSGLCSIVNLGDRLCHHLGIGPIQRPLAGPEGCEACQTLQIGVEELDAIAEDFSSRLSQDKRLFGF